MLLLGQIYKWLGHSVVLLAIVGTLWARSLRKGRKRVGGSNCNRYLCFFVLLWPWSPMQSTRSKSLLTRRSRPLHFVPLGRRWSGAPLTSTLGLQEHADTFHPISCRMRNALTQPVLGQPSLYTVSSKAQGAPFDLVVTETKREPNKSFISVPGFHNRTAPGARWLMCAYTDLAIKRGFLNWVVVYPPESSEVLVVAFFQLAECLGQRIARQRLQQRAHPWRVGHASREIPPHVWNTSLTK